MAGKYTETSSIPCICVGLSLCTIIISVQSRPFKISLFLKNWTTHWPQTAELSGSWFVFVLAGCIDCATLLQWLPRDLLFTDYLFVGNRASLGAREIEGDGGYDLTP